VQKPPAQINGQPLEETQVIIEPVVEIHQSMFGYYNPVAHRPLALENNRRKDCHDGTLVIASEVTLMSLFRQRSAR
jgi:hypothetical protein